MTAARCPTCDRDYCNLWLWSRRADRNPAFPTQAHHNECAAHAIATLRARALAAEADAARWQRVAPLIERLRSFEAAPATLQDVLTVALDIIAATTDRASAPEGAAKP